MKSSHRGLQIDEDSGFQKKEWFVQRVGIALLFLFVAAAALGVMGRGGPFSSGAAGERGGPLFVEFERFVRRDAESMLTVHLRAAPGELRFWVSAPYLRQVQVDSVMPDARLVSADDYRYVYAIHTAAPEVTVRLVFVHRAAGRLNGEVGLLDGPSVRFTQLSWF